VIARDEDRAKIQKFFWKEKISVCKEESSIMKEYIQVFTTTEKKEDAEKIAQTLVKERLAGCVQIIGTISSVYRWKNKIEKAEEWLCLIKSEKRLYAELEKTIKGMHQYETPEITSLPIVAGSKEYLQWLDKELKG
jgi:periplasmic divalent cation tolerance protein